MGQTTDQIASHIESTREDLNSNLQELETKVKSATDWRHHFRRHPGLALAAAFGGGVLLSTLIGKRRVPSPASPNASEAAPAQTSASGHETWDAIKSALAGVAATKFAEMLAAVVPGFSEHLRNTEGERGQYQDSEKRSH